MKEIFLNLVAYLKNPVLEKDTNTDLKYRFKIFFQILVIGILTGFIITPIFALIQELDLVNMENHKLADQFKEMGIPLMLLIGAIVVPAIEEAIFRGPITLFKKPKSFKIAFYFFALIFGFVHLSNFEFTTNVLLLSPILVLPQILLGGYLGYIRVRFGLQWSILLHGTYNCFFLLISTLIEF
ncbi:CPBP family intramembrane glutamic endopeptidase [Polaribacter sp. SA4-12]|uniref:CPBP family intramembrane glutamic endopeptidase n=1 Tax=Polaribacter sp. SA4-12 TaxID=1312072 RepID=UPI000B3CE4C6|nr:CPBP family intramembrane glutamic endopeptidase [Polaribacter sp. SA4-12]ARV14476.1 CAAX protease [Polaribacter sp. SA4-12]